MVSWLHELARSSADVRYAGAFVAVAAAVLLQDVARWAGRQWQARSRSVGAALGVLLALLTGILAALLIARGRLSSVPWLHALAPSATDVRFVVASAALVAAVLLHDIARLAGRLLQTRRRPGRSAPIIDMGPLSPRWNRVYPEDERTSFEIYVGTTGELLSPEHAISPSETLRIRVSGPADSGAGSFPPEAVSAEEFHDTASLRAVVTSTDFFVAVTEEGLEGRPSGAEQALRRPDASARYPASSAAEFVLRPAIRRGRGQIRVSFFRADILIASNRIRITVGSQPSTRFEVTDYQVPRTSAGPELDLRPARLNVVINDGPMASHQVVLRYSGSAQGSHEPVALSLQGKGLEDVADDVRRKLTVIMEGSRVPTKDRLISQLRLLAPEGLKLHHALFKQASTEVFGPLRTMVPRPILSVTRPKHVELTIPWSCVYQISLTDRRRSKNIEVCPLVADWDGHSALVDQMTDECPRSADADHTENLLCPFGFYGYRQPIEIRASTIDINDVITMMPGARMAVAVSNRIAEKESAGHLDDVERLLKGGFPDLIVDSSTSWDKLREALSSDLPLVYFYCHGQRASRKSEIFLSIGNDEAFSADDFQNWVEASWAKPPVIWSAVRPLVFLNACQSLAITPATLLSYVDSFIGSANALGVIGTEVKVRSAEAAEFASAFYRLLVKYSGEYQPGGSVYPFERALRAARFQFLGRGSLFGLAYTGHGWSTLRLGRPDTMIGAGATRPELEASPGGPSAALDVQRIAAPVGGLPEGGRSS